MATNYNPRTVTDGLVLCLDAGNRKSSGELVTNGTFDTDISNWIKLSGNATATRSTSIFSNGAFSLTVSDSVYVAYSQNVPAIPNVEYRVSWQHYATDGATARVIVWDGATTTRLIQQNQSSSNNIVTYTFLVTPTQDYLRFSIDAPGSANGTQHVDNISIKKSATSTLWTDLSGRGNNGTLTNGPTYSGANGGSLVFDGVDDRVDASPTNFNLLEFSVNIWFKSNSVSSDYLRLIHKADTTSSTKGFLIANSQTDGKLVFVYQPNYTTGEVSKRSTTLVSVGIWYNVSMTYNSSSGIKIYFNGIEDTGETSTSPDVGWSSNTGNLFSIGSRAGGSQNYNGNIAQVSIYNRALTAAEIQQNFNALRGRFGI